jgi:hypothetical protein
MGHSKGSPKRKVYSHKCINKRTERSEINDIMLQVKLLEKQEQANPKTSRREIIKIRAQTNEIETTTKKTRINKTKAGSLKKINKIDRPLANLTKMGKEKKTNQ